MKICHFSTLHSRYDTRVFHKECVSLAKAGYEVHYIVADGKGKEFIDGVHIDSVVLSPHNKVERVLKGGRAIIDKVMSLNADVYHIHDPELLPVAIKLKKQNKTVIFDYHDDTQVDILEKDWIHPLLRKPISFAFKYYEKYVFPKLDAVIVVTPGMKDRIFKNGLDVTAIITNYPILADWDDANSDIFLNPTNKLCFAGNIYHDWCHELILDALNEINEDIKYILAGDITQDYYKKLEAKNAWSKVEFLGKVKKDEVKQIYSQSVAGLVIHRYCSSAYGKMGTMGNNKMFELMASARPIICTDFVLWKEVVDKWHCGLCVPPYDVSAIKSAIEYIINNPIEAKIMGENGRRAVLEEYNWGTQETTLLSIYNSFTKTL